MTPADTIFPGYEKCKSLQPSDDIVTSLIALRDELWADKDDRLNVVFWKINSCLYSQYPD